jgi:hypothetical protein
MNFTNKTQKMINTCPRCDGTMSPKRRTDDKGNAVKIFVCDDCYSIFMYPKNYQIIKDNRLLQEKDAKDKKDKEDKYHPNTWWLFYPHIMSTGSMSHSSIAHFGGGSFGGGGGSDSGSSSSRSSSPSYSSCVSCACVSACACACACAGGGAAGCAPKDKIKQIDIRKLYKK